MTIPAVPAWIMCGMRTVAPDRGNRCDFWECWPARCCLLLQPAAIRAQTIWDMPTEYPENAMPGLGVATFAKHIAEFSAGKLQIRPSFDAAAGIRSAAMLAAIAEGRVQAGDALAGALEAEDAIFALPTLPFLARSNADARRLADIARPYLAAALQKRGLRLLYLTPWPPSGIWSKMPLKSPSDLAGLSIRTYDKISSEVFASVGARATAISFADTMSRLADGSINAVLSSGDGGTGRKLWQYLPYFSEITYSLPLSVASVNQAVYDGLSAEICARRSMKQAANRERIVARAVNKASGELSAHAQQRRHDRHGSCRRPRRSVRAGSGSGAAGLVHASRTGLRSDSRRLQRQANSGLRDSPRRPPRRSGRDRLPRRCAHAPAHRPGRRAAARR